MSELRFIVYGHPAPKGSLRHVGNGRLVEQVKGSRPWREQVVVAAAQARDSMAWETATGPVEVVSIVLIERPKTSRHEHPITRSSGDIDKHQRNILDALVDAQIIRDDSQVIRIRAEKTHAPRAGANITVRTIESDTP
jgi:crossover junction endodeoxyribonuclease RusA